MNDFYLDNDGYQAVLTTLGDAAGAFKKAADTMSSSLESNKGCWGDDKIGLGFQKNYWDDAETARTNSGPEADGISGSVGNFKKTGDDLSAVDDESAAEIDSTSTFS